MSYEEKVPDVSCGTLQANTEWNGSCSGVVEFGQWDGESSEAVTLVPHHEECD